MSNSPITRRARPVGKEKRDFLGAGFFICELGARRGSRFLHGTLFFLWHEGGMEEEQLGQIFETMMK